MGTLSLSVDAQEDLEWELKNLEAWNGKSIFGNVLNLVLESDASNLGWGARMNSLETGGRCPDRNSYFT